MGNRSDGSEWQSRHERIVFPTVLELPGADVDGAASSVGNAESTSLAFASGVAVGAAAGGSSPLEDSPPDGVEPDDQSGRTSEDDSIRNRSPGDELSDR